MGVQTISYSIYARILLQPYMPAILLVNICLTLATHRSSLPTFHPSCAELLKILSQIVSQGRAFTSIYNGCMEAPLCWLSMAATSHGLSLAFESVLVQRVNCAAKHAVL